MDVEQKVRIQRVVLLACDRIDPVDPGVDLVDPTRRGMGLGFRAERDRVRQHQRPLQPLPRAPVVHLRLVHAGDDERVGGLHQQSSGATEQDGDLPIDLPADATRSEVPEILV